MLPSFINQLFASKTSTSGALVAGQLGFGKSTLYMLSLLDRAMSESRNGLFFGRGVSKGYVHKTFCRPRFLNVADPFYSDRTNIFNSSYLNSIADVKSAL